MGSGYSERVLDSLHQPARSKKLAKSKSSYIFCTAKLADPGGEHTTREGCYYSDRQSSTTGELLFNPISGPQERGSNEASHQPKKLSDWVKPQHFKVEGMGTLRDLLRVNDWMVKVDLKDAYFTIPIHPTHQPFLSFVNIFSLPAYPSACPVCLGHSPR